MYVGFDYAVHDDFTIGASTAFDLGGFDAMNILMRGDFHWNSLMEIPREWDFYTGADLGGDLPINKYSGWWFSFSRYTLEAVTILTYKWALHTEIGGGTGLTYVMGMSMRF